MTLTTSHTRHILIATGLSSPDIGGPATYTAFLEKHLPKYGIDFLVIPFGAVRKYPKVIRHLAYLFALVRAGRSCDVIYALDTVSVGFPAMLASFILRKPLYLRVPGDYAWEQGQQRFGIMETLDVFLQSKDQPWIVRIFAWLQYHVAKYATKIIVPSDYMQAVVTAWGIDDRKITRIYSALKVIEIPESKETLRTEFGYRGFVVVTSARLVPWKGVSALIDAIQSLRKEHFDVSLEIIGDGSSRNNLEEQVRKNGISEYVHFRGTVAREVLGKYIKAGDAFVLNTSYEGLSHQLLEVMDIGLPIITTAVGGNVELITHRKEGILVPFNDTNALMQALKDLYHSEELRTSLVVGAHEKVQMFHEDCVVTEFITFLKK